MPILLALACAGAAEAQVYARWAVPDSLLAPALRTSGGGYERTWNALLVAELRASLAHADSATRLATLAKRVAAAEPGAFGTRIAPDAGSRPPEVVYPDKRTSRRIALGMPLRLAMGTAGFLPHLTFAALAALEIVALRRGPLPCAITTAALTLFAIFMLSLAVRARLQRPLVTWTVATVVGLMLGLGPLGLRAIMPRTLLMFGDLLPVAVGHAFLGSFLLGLFLLVLALTGLEHHQGFAVLGHPGFRHFVRLCVHPSGTVEGFVIGKDDPIGPGRPVLIDHFTWN